jgi:hypothetical protein
MHLAVRQWHSVTHKTVAPLAIQHNLLSTFRVTCGSSEWFSNRPVFDGVVDVRFLTFR